MLFYQDISVTYSSGTFRDYLLHATEFLHKKKIYFFFLDRIEGMLFRKTTTWIEMTAIPMQIFFFYFFFPVVDFVFDIEQTCH